jgi:hypothetical protein
MVSKYLLIMSVLCLEVGVGGECKWCCRRGRLRSRGGGRNVKNVYIYIYLYLCINILRSTDFKLWSIITRNLINNA